MVHHHEPFKALNPAEWADVSQNDLKTYLDDIFTDAHTIVESVPSPASTASKPGASSGKGASEHGRARSKTESAVPDQAVPGRLQTLAASEQSHQLQQEWKEVKLNPKDNPLAVKVYKLSSKDGRGAWFARRSLHQGLTFDQWKTGLESEFHESMKVQGDPGSGAIRGIGADKKVEDHDVPDAGKVQVFQLSAQFPGPTSPRDFITLFLTSDFSHSTPDRALRQFMIVSKPCVHPDCPPRSGIIRGQYESVEIIREVPAEPAAAKRSYSSVDLGASEKPVISKSPASDLADGAGSSAVAIEWLMVTRSDPGGSVPRFMIEKGTPPGIVNDAGKFLEWVNRITNGDAPTDESPANDGSSAPAASPKVAVSPAVPPTEPALSPNVVNQNHEDQNDAAWSTNGLYGMITGAFATATSVVSGGLQRQPATHDEDEDDSDDLRNRKDAEEDLSSSETSTLRSFTSALEKSLSGPGGEPLTDSAQGSQSEDKSQEGHPQAKELKRLQERRRKLDEKAAKMAERLETKRTGDNEKDAAAMAKLREKHEKEIAKQEAKYKRELKRIEDKKEQEERKAEERRKKQADREEKASAALELDRVKAERDIALKQIQMLKTQVGDLQEENTKLAARLGKATLLDGQNSRSASSANVELAAAGSVASPRVSS